ncbi:unnamed protein product [Hanseniaspora opuntiae]
MNVKLEEPELTPLEKKSSFERERGEKKVRIWHDEHAFVDSDDEEYLPKPVENKRNSTKLMTNANATTLRNQEKTSAKPEKKKGLGTKLKKMFGKSKKS